MAESLKKKTVKGVAWTSLETFSNLGFGFIISVVLARLLSPSDYGLLAMIAVFNAIAYAFMDSGFGNALIRKPDLTENDNCTAFYFNVVAGIFLYGILWIVAPYVADFYNKPILKPLLRSESVMLILYSLKIVQNTQLSRALDFRSKAIINVSSNILAGIIAIIAAYNGLGVWSLVIQHISSGLISLILLWFISSWRPHGRWDNNSFKYLWGYGSKLLASGLLNTIYGNIYPIIIGKLFSAADLGQYTRASSFAGLPSQSLTNILQRVSFPVLSQIQKEENRLAGSYRRMLRFTAFIVFPVMIGMAALAHPFVIVLVTNKWAQCVPYLQIICLSSMWYPIHVINLNLLQVKGRSDLFLKLEIAKKAIATIAIFASVPFGIIGICIGGVCTSIICLVINTYYTGKLINIGFLKQMRDLTPILLLSLTMGLLVYFSTLFFSNEMVKLLFGIIIGIVFYLFCSWIFGLPELKEAINILKRR